MSLLKNLKNHYHLGYHAGRHHVRQRPYIVPILGLLLGISIVGAVLVSRDNNVVRPSDSHVVFLFDNGNKETLDTKAATVGDLVNKLPLHLIPEDVVEPSKDTKIVEDNFRINIYRARPVAIEDGGSKAVTVTAKRSARVAAADAGVTVYPEDNVDFAPGSIQNNVIGEEVVIERATPVKLGLYGTEVTVRTQTKTVADLLKEKNIKPTAQDTVLPNINAALTPGIEVLVVRNGTQVVTTEEEIPAPTQIVNDSSLSLGASAVRQNGSPGKRAVTYQIVTKNGAEVSRTILQQAIIQPPVPTIIARGVVVDVSGDKTAIMAAAGISSGDYGYVNFIVSHESGWRVTASNASGAYGLCQALPGSKMASAGSDWETNPITQLRWCNGYAVGHYGGWAAAYNFWVSHRYW